MIIGIFRVNRPFTPILLIILAVLLWLDGFIFHANVLLPETHTAPLYGPIAHLFNQYTFLNVLLSFVFVMLQAFMLNRIITDKNLTERNSFFPALMYIVFMSGYIGFMGLQPALFANFFLILALDKIFEVFSEEAVHVEIFNVGFFIALTGLFYLPALPLFLLLIVSLILYFVVGLRSLMASLMGFAVPFVFTFLYYFWFDRTEEWLQIYSEMWNIGGRLPGDLTTFGWISMILFLLLGLISVLKLYVGVLPDRPVRIRKRFQVLLAYLFIAVLPVFIIVLENANWQMILLLPFSVIMAAFFQENKNTRVNNIIFLFVLIVIVAGKIAGE